ncbi:MAG: hypothetical protein J6P44_05975 [Bacteroidales bacterium]|nr:hypothetical protein [Bacteroidales bacterium]
MKNYKKLLLVAVAALSFAACGDDDDDDKKGGNDQQTEVTNNVNVSVFNGESKIDNPAFSIDDVDVQTTCVDSTKTCDVLMQNVTFSEGMKQGMGLMDFAMNGVSFAVQNGDTVLTGANIEPEAFMHGQSAGSAGYVITSINGKITKGELTFEAVVHSSRGNSDMNMTFTGKRK